jgi:tripartite-type tricarboxylate transporter receptor subunit TctC
MFNRRSLLLSLTAVAAGASFPAAAEDYPDRPIKLLVPFPAGGPVDTVARLLARELPDHLGVSVVIENIGGAGGTLGARMAAKASPDGYTLLMAPVSTLCIAPLIYRVEFDARKAFVPVALVSSQGQALVAGPAAPSGSLTDVITFARKHPGRLNYGSTLGIAPQLIMELLKIRANIDIPLVPYRGVAPAITDLLAGQVHLTVVDKAVVLPYVRAGRLRALAVNSAARWPELPGVPTLREAGFEDIPTETWFGVLAPTGTSAHAISRLDAAISAALLSRRVGDGAASLWIDTKFMDAGEFARFIDAEIPRWAKIIELTGVHID